MTSRPTRTCSRTRPADRVQTGEEDEQGRIEIEYTMPGLGSVWVADDTGRRLRLQRRRRGREQSSCWSLVNPAERTRRTGHRVRISGFEEWTIDDDGVIAASLGDFDQAEHDRELERDIDS